jgi:S1-C subfamily serine protease
LAGIRPGDVILGFDDKQLEMDAYDFLDYVALNYIVGDEVQVNIVRDGKPLKLPMRLR